MPAREITFEVDNIIIPPRGKVSNNTIIEIEENPTTLEVTTNAPTRPPLVLRPAGRINLITDDGSQYDDDNLQMFQRAGIIIRDKNDEDNVSTQGEADDIGEARLERTDKGGNIISEPILDLTNPNIKQLIVIYPTYQDKTLNQNRLLLTGRSFYEKLENDFKNRNVYAINAAFDERFAIKIVLSDILEIMERNTLAEQGLGIEMYRNLAFLDTGEIDYNLLISYIDWLVSKPNYLEFVDGNVVPIEYIADYSIRGRPSIASELEGQDTVLGQIESNNQTGQGGTSTSGGDGVTTTAGVVSPQFPPFGEAGVVSEIREFLPTGQLYIFTFNYNVGRWIPYEIGQGGGAASTSGGVGATDLSGNSGGSLGGGGNNDPSGGPGGGRPGPQ